MLDQLTLPDLIGILGSLTVCSAYFGVSSGRLDPEKLPYQVINIVGATLLLISLYFRPNPGAILIEVVWVCIALWAIARIYLKR